MPTDRRKYRVAKALHQRQSDLIVALNEVHDPHNVSAVVRSADATGVGHVIWEPDIYTTGELNTDVSKGSERWVNIEKVNKLYNKLEGLKSEGFQIVATHMSKKSVDFRTIDWTKKCVIVMGNEQRGCSNEIAEIADVNISLPMLGFVQSLNISVATAVILYEIQRQRELAGMYKTLKDEKEVKTYFKEWNLENDDFQIKDVLLKPNGEMPTNNDFHQDGRSFRKVPLKPE